MNLSVAPPYAAGIEALFPPRRAGRPKSIMPFIAEPARFTKEEFRAFLVSYPHVKALFDEASKQHGLPLIEESSVEVMVHVAQLTDEQQRKIGAAAMREIERHLARNRGKAWSLPHIVGAAAALLLMGWLAGLAFNKNDPVPQPTPTPSPVTPQQPDVPKTSLNDIDFAFNSAILADADNTVEAEQKVANWEKFLTDYAQDDPATTHDDELRQVAEAKKAQWLQSAMPTPTPLVVAQATATPKSTSAPSLPKEWKDPVTGMEFVLIPAGEFLMGTPCKMCDTLPKEPPRQDDPFTEADEAKPCVEAYQRDVKACQDCQERDEAPAHRVVISMPFYLGKYEVTQEEWYKIMGNNPSEFKSEKVGMNSRRHPVEMVSWNDAQEFLKRLNARSSGVTFRLPTEAEWEYAARAGTQTAYSFGDNPAQLGDYEWYDDNSHDMTHPVGEKLPNAFGLYDMHGNVWEWLTDSWHENYRGAPTDGSAWEQGGDAEQRLLRGGSGNNPDISRSAYRVRDDPDYLSPYIGVRVVAVLARTP